MNYKPKAKQGYRNKLSFLSYLNVANNYLFSYGDSPRVRSAKVLIFIGFSRLIAIFFSFSSQRASLSKLFCIFAIGSGRNPAKRRSICYYFALSQNAQETVWNKIRSEVIEIAGCRNCASPFHLAIAMHSRQ